MARRSTKGKAPASHEDRIAAARRAMREHETDALIVVDPMDVAYLTGFLGGDSWLILPKSRRRPVLVSDARYAEDVEPLSGLCAIRMRAGSMAAAITDVVNSMKLKRVSLQAEHTTLAARDALAKALGAKRVGSISGLVGQLRAIKDAGEVSQIKRALKIQQDALLATLPTIEPGQTELEACARLEYEMKARGSSDPSFATIVAARANSSKPHASPGKMKIAAGKPLLIDWGATRQGYHGDMTRTFSLGKWSKAMREIYLIVLDAHLAAVAALQAGATNHRVDAAARDVITRAGYGEQFGHGLGHGVGLNVHEAPSLGHKGPPVTLQPGHVVTIEPGIYLPGVGGVRIEDIHVVTQRGSTNLSKLPKDLDWATL